MSHRAVTVALLAALALAQAPAARAEEPVPPADINAAIDLGVKGLLKSQRPDGSWSGPELFPPHLNIRAAAGTVGREGITAIALLALLASDVRHDHPALARGFERLYAQRAERIAKTQPGQVFGFTYDEGVVCMALHAWSEAIGKAKNKGREPAKTRVCYLSTRARAWLGDVAADLAASRTEDDSWGYRTVRASAGVAEGGDSSEVRGGGSGSDRRMSARDMDHSNTQYAVLGLRAAELAGFAIRGRLWQDVLDHFLTAQGQGRGRAEPPPDGPEMSGSGSGSTAGRAEPRGWGYKTGEPGTMTMTCAGLAMVVIAREQLASHRQLRESDGPRIEASIADGLAWLGEHYVLVGSSGPGQDPRNKPNRKPATEEVDGYLLYGLERAAILCGKDLVGAHDWYNDGARLLLDRQTGAGTWNGMHGSAVETAFALLFLKRATRPVAIEMSDGPK